MILVLDSELNQKVQNELCLKLQKKGFYTRLVDQYGCVLLAIDGPGEEKLYKEVSSWNGVKDVLSGKNSFFLASRKCLKKDSRIEIKRSDLSVSVGAGNFLTIAGPCAIETEESALRLAECVERAQADVFRAMIFKPRSSPYSFQGLGKSGIPVVRKIKERTKLAILVEVRDPFEAELVHDVADIFQVGTRNMSNFQLLKHLGQFKKPVILKRGMGASIEELLCAAEYVLAHGNPDVILCERGIRTFEHYTRFSLDIGAVSAVKELSHLPIIVDPSHASGKSSLVESLALASVAAGADGIMLEIHETPGQAFSDGAQSLKPEQFNALSQKIRNLNHALAKI